jgi:hypothetical protein
MASATRNPPRPVGSTGLAALRLGLAALLLPLPLTNPGAAAAQSLDVPGMVRVTVEVELSCPSCALGLERRLGRLDHVAVVDVRPADGRIVLTVDPGRHLDLAAVWDTVRNAGFIRDGVAVTAVGRLTRASGAPALVLSPDFALPLAANGTAALETEAGNRLLLVSGHWNAAPDGLGRLQVESFEEVR